MSAKNSVGHRDIAPSVAIGALRAMYRRRREFRERFLRDGWTITKRLGAEGVQNVEISDLPWLRDAVAEAFVDDRTRVVLAAVCRALGCRAVFEIGTAAGRTTWSIAKTNPDAEIWTLDLPGRNESAHAQLELLASDRPFILGDERRGHAFRGTPEEGRITQLIGDSATFDFTPYEGKVDLVFVDGSHSYEYVRNDTLAALRMITDEGTIVWDDYPHFPGIWQYLNELAGELDGPIYHLHDTRLAYYRRST